MYYIMLHGKSGSELEILRIMIIFWKALHL